MNVDPERLAEEFFPCCWQEVAKCPHRIVPASSESVSAVLDAVNRSGGIFGDYPLYGSSGEPYIEPEDGRMIEGFDLWANPRNQELVRTLGANEKLTGFTMVIDAETPRDVLTSIYNIAPDDAEYFAYDLFIREVPKIIDKLGWAYIPIAGEVDLALLIVSSKNVHLLSAVEQRIKASEGRVAVLEDVEGSPSLKETGTGQAESD